MSMRQLLIFSLLLILAYSCNETQDSSPEGQKAQFILRTAEETGLDFSNDLPVDIDLNILNYMYYYNGAGLAAADFNNDGLIDIFFSANRGQERLYLNQGNLQFMDVTASTNIDGGADGWSTGVSVVDINNDGLNDIYLCQVGDFRQLRETNKLFICEGIDDNGVPQYVERAQEYGLDFSGFSTQASFFDYDLDGDLDMFLLNHSLHHNGTFGKRKDFVGTYHDLSGDRLYRNDGDTFTDVTKTSGIESSVIGYGLGVAITDVNWDGYPDIFIGNDFHENDYLYLNQGDGTFVESATSLLPHMSKFSMGVDAADLNNDLYPDVLSLDMLPEDPIIRKSSQGEEELSILNFKKEFGYYQQFAKNALHINNCGHGFSELAMYAGVHASDWSWSPLLYDFNLDGHKDIFISNGIPRRMNDIDHVNYYRGSDLMYKVKVNDMTDDDLEQINRIPEIKIKNKFFLSNGDITFSDAADRIVNNINSYSNSAVAIDLDNDGDLDIVTNNINDSAFVYENVSSNNGNYLSINLKGNNDNIDAIGTKLILEDDAGTKQMYENYFVKGFQASMKGKVVFGLGNNQPKELTVIWPDRTQQVISTIDTNSITIEYNDGLATYNPSEFQCDFSIGVKDVANEVNIVSQHEENNFVEFHREVLIPHLTSDEGPALAVGDLNGDNLEDVFIGSSKTYTAGLYFQQKSGYFEPAPKSFLPIDSFYEEVTAEIADFDGDQINDLIIGTGGNEFLLNNQYTQPLLFKGTVSGELQAIEGAFDSIQLTTGALVVADWDKDGALDLYLGARAEPWNYGLRPRSFVLRNRGDGTFEEYPKDKIDQDILSLGMITGAVSLDASGDGFADLIVAVEWDKLYLIPNEKGHLGSPIALSSKKGLWKNLFVIDYNNDGLDDVIVGNTGRNTFLKPNQDGPVRMYVNDFDDNDKIEQVVTYMLQGKEVVLHDILELHKTLPITKKRYQYAQDFARASIADIFGQKKLDEALYYECDYVDNAVLINQGNGQFELQSLPDNLQIAPIWAGCKSDLDGDQVADDLILAGNYDGNSNHIGPYDASYGHFLIADDESYKKVNSSGDILKGEIRNIEVLHLDKNKEKYYIAVRNNGKVSVLKTKLNN